MTNLELVLTKDLYHCYFFRSMKKNVCVMCSVIPFKAVTAIWQLARVAKPGGKGGFAPLKYKERGLSPLKTNKLYIFIVYYN